MSREYGTRRSSKQKGGLPQQFLIIIVTFLLGYLTASFFDVQTITHWMNSQVLAQNEVKHQQTKAESQHAQIPPKPKFEFYTLLANEKGAPQPNANTASTHATTAPVSSPPSAQTTPNTTTIAVASAANNAVKVNATSTKQNVAVKVAEGKPLAPSQSGKGSYLVQVASFKARQDAEHMKGLLTLKGFDVTVVPVAYKDKGNWFRVVVGPYPNRVLAQKAQVTLAKTERLNGMVTTVGG